MGFKKIYLFWVSKNDFFGNRCSVYQEDLYDKTCSGAFIPESINSIFSTFFFSELIFPKHHRPSLYRSVPL
jgi:hypothetical protein